MGCPPRMKKWIGIAGLAGLLVLPGCAQYAVATKVKPVPPAAAAPAVAAAASRATVPGESSVTAILDAAAAEWSALRSHPADVTHRDSLNFLTARLCGALNDGCPGAWRSPATLPGGWRISTVQHVSPGESPSNYVVMPADEFELSGSYINQRSLRSGVGAPLIAVSRAGDTLKKDRFAQGNRVYYATTAVLSFKGKDCTLNIYDPLSVDRVEVGGRHYPLAADYTAPLAMTLASARVQRLEIARMLNPEKYRSTARLARLQPYDPDKIPVVFVHGLASSPAAWVPMVNTLRADPEIQRHYQFWFFSYPSGWPYPMSAAHLRRELDAMSAAHSGHKPIVLVGHSMGGCISRLLITDTGDQLWRQLFGKSPAETQLSPATRKTLEEMLIFERRRDVARVVFMAAPLRGSELAGNPLGRFGSRLVKAPAGLLGIGAEAISLMLPHEGTLSIRGVPNSVDTLAPNNRFVQAINTIPISRAVPVHTVCGDRGKGGNRDQTKPVMTDGIVPYWSSHLDQAESERIVPSGHGAEQHPEGIAEVARILHLHLRR